MPSYKADIIHQKITLGWLAVPNIRYYYAVLLSAVFQWSNRLEANLIEQWNIPIPLKGWFLLDKDIR